LRKTRIDGRKKKGCFGKTRENEYFHRKGKKANTRAFRAKNLFPEGKWKIED